MAPRLTPAMIVGGSFILTTITVVNAFYLKKQFYPSVVYLTKDGSSMAILYFQGFVLGYLLFTFFRWIFFGQLRIAETEHALDRFWHAIVETCLAFTVFRDDFSPRFVIQFVVLFFFKGFHWLAEDRVDYMERSPLITNLFHVRILGIVSLLAAVDSYFVSSAYFTTLMRGASVQIVFGFEYAILLTTILHIAMKYLLHIYDLRSPHPWEAKAVYMLYTELVVTGLRCALYLLFSVVMMRIHTFPLFAIRPFYLTLRSLRKAVNDVVQSRRAIHAMNTLYPLATEQELLDGDNTCIICREEMTLASGPKKLPCNHIFHPNCLRSWFQRQQTCPTCRTDVLGAAANLPNQPQPAQPDGLAAFLAGVRLPQFQPNQGAFFQVPNQPAPANQPAGPLPQVNMQGNQIRLNFGPLLGQDMAGPQLNIMAGPLGGAQPIPVNPQPNAPHMHATSVNGPFVFPTPTPFPDPPTYAGLSDLELAAMEGQTRAAIEARLQALSNINTLLEAATLQFQQYMAVAPQIPLPQPLREPASSQDNSQANNAEPPILPTEHTSSNNNNAEPDPVRNRFGPSGAQVVPIAPVTSLPGTSETESGEVEDLANAPTDESTDTLINSTDPSHSIDEVRRRRIAAFERNAEN